MGTY